MTAAGAAGGMAISWLSVGIPNPIAVAVYALIASVVSWLVAQVLAYIKRRLAL